MGSQPQNKTIFLASTDQLACPQCYDWMWSTAVSLPHLSSGGWLNAIEELFRDLDILGIKIRHSSGDLFEIPFIDDVFAPENESGRRWVSNFRKADASGTKPRYQCRCVPKLLCIELLLQATVAKYIRRADTPRCSSTHYPLGW